MRLRNIADSPKFIDQSPYVVKRPEHWKGLWNLLFSNDNPIHLEIGIGKGHFIRTLASKNPNINFIGIEKFTSVLYRAIEQIEDDKCSNLLFIRINAEEICEIFEEGEIFNLFLNFSDPWPKKRHEKRRLTSYPYLLKYKSILNSEGTLQFKTDNKDLFDFSVNELQNADWKINTITRDLHNSDYRFDNEMTEYEEKFTKMGKPIYQLTASH